MFPLLEWEMNCVLQYMHHYSRLMWNCDPLPCNLNTFHHHFICDRSSENLSDSPESQSLPDGDSNGNNTCPETLVLNTHQLAVLSSDDTVCVENKLFTYEDDSLAHCPMRIHGESWLAAKEKEWSNSRMGVGRFDAEFIMLVACLHVQSTELPTWCI